MHKSIFPILFIYLSIFNELNSSNNSHTGYLKRIQVHNGLMLKNNKGASIIMFRAFLLY